MIDPVAVSADLAAWAASDPDSLCSAWEVPPASVLARYGTDAASQVRHVEGRSLLVVTDGGTLLWFAVAPDLDEGERLSEVADMLGWLRDHTDVPVYRGIVGDTTFSRWVWRDVLGAEWLPQPGGRVLVRLSRDAGIAWLERQESA